MNIEDGCKNCSFPSLETMLACPKNERFKNYGLWHNSHNNFINNIKEYYYSDSDVSKEDPVDKANPKKLKFVFDINGSAVSKNFSHNLTYTMSIPGLHPITDYKYDPNKSTIPGENMCSCINVQYDILSIKYVIGFENGFEFEIPPECCIYRKKSGYNKKVINIPCKVRNNNFYTYYEFDLIKLKYNDQVKIQWKLKK